MLVQVISVCQFNSGKVMLVHVMSGYVGSCIVRLGYIILK
jgi:hypothetical protein